MENRAFSMSYVREKAAQGENQIERTIHDILDLINHYPDFDGVFEALDNTYELYRRLQQTTLDPARRLPVAARMSQVNHLHLKTLLEIAHVIGRKVLIGVESPFNDMFIYQEFSKYFMFGLVEAFERWFITGPYHYDISRLDKMKVRDIFEAHEKNIEFLYDWSMSDVNHISILKAIFLTMYLMARDVETEWVAQDPTTRLCTVLFPLNTEELTKRLSREFEEEGEKDVLEILHETVGKYTIQKLRKKSKVDEKDPRLAKCEKLIKRDIEDMEVLYNYKNPAIAKSDIVKSGYYRLCRLSSNMSKIMYNQVEEQEA